MCPMRPLAQAIFFSTSLGRWPTPFGFVRNLLKGKANACSAVWCVAMFGSLRATYENFDNLLRRVDVIENVVGLLGLRIAARENMMRYVFRMVNEHEAHVAECKQTDSLFDVVFEAEPPLSFTAGLAEQAPLYVEGPAEEEGMPLEPPLPPAPSKPRPASPPGFGSSTSIARLNLLQQAAPNLHGSLERDSGSANGNKDSPEPEAQSFTFSTPCQTPRRSTAEVQSPPDKEPIWGKTYLQHKTQMVGMQKGHREHQRAT